MTSEQLKNHKLPDSPGVYFFLDKRKKPIYIGKATSLKDRVKSYFSKDLIDTRGPLIVKMIEESKSIDFKKTASVLEALLLEADLIKKIKPTYNTKEKDDKSFNCVVITKEYFPQILTVRKRDIDFSSLTAGDSKLKAVFGPYPNGGQLKEALKIIRKLFPYRDEKCHLPKLSGSSSTRPCFNYSIGLCPGTCIGAIDKKCYAKRIRRIELFLSGNIKKLTDDLEKDMKSLAKEHKFEPAKILRDKIYALNHINDISLLKADPYKSSDSSVFRIEAYDIAHFAGKEMVGAMVAVSDGIPEKKSYRKFSIKSVNSPNDPKALGEVLKRRFAHTEWQFPNIVVVDGNLIQRNVAENILNDLKINIPVVSVVKDEKHRAKGIMGDESIIKKYKKEIILANSEAHRFVIAFHKKVRARNFLI